MVTMSDSEFRQIVMAELEAQKYEILLATNSAEARLKFTNSTNNFLIIEDDMPGLSAKEFVHNIRRKEEMKSIKDRPILVIGSDAQKYHANFQDFSNCKFLQKPFSTADFKKNC